ncbi:MAG: phasin family protein [Thermodesulfobacteriota bacterium]
MLDDLKKGFFAGIGVVLLTKDKIEQFTEKLVEENKLKREDAQRLTDELVKNGEDQWSDLEKRISDAAKKGVATLDIGKKSEVEALRERVENLEMRLQMMEESTPTAGVE